MKINNLNLEEQVSMEAVLRAAGRGEYLHHPGLYGETVTRSSRVVIPNHFARLAIFAGMGDLGSESEGPSLTEYLVMFYTFARLRLEGSLSATIEVKLSVLGELLHVLPDGSGTYKHWEAVIARLSTRRVAYAINQSVASCGIFEICELNKETWTIKLKLSKTLSENLRLEGNRVTIMNYGYLAQLHSASSIRLYTIVKSIQDEKYNLVYEVDQMKKLFGFSGSTSRFISEKLVPALFRINHCTDIVAKVQLIWEGHTIRWFRLKTLKKGSAEKKSSDIRPNGCRVDFPKLTTKEMRACVIDRESARSWLHNDLLVGGITEFD